MTELTADVIADFKTAETAANTVANFCERLMAHKDKLYKDQPDTEHEWCPGHAMKREMPPLREGQGVLAKIARATPGDGAVITNDELGTLCALEDDTNRMQKMLRVLSTPITLMGAQAEEGQQAFQQEAGIQLERLQKDVIAPIQKHMPLLIMLESEKTPEQRKAENSPLRGFGS